MNQHLIIIGNGVAGITAALTARERDPQRRITVLDNESDYFFSRTALMYAYMDRLGRRDLEPNERHVYRNQRIELLRGRVVDLDATKRLLRLTNGEELRYDQLLLATGSVPNSLKVEGLDEVAQGGVSFVSLQDLDRCEALTPSTAVGLKHHVETGEAVMAKNIGELAKRYATLIEDLHAQRRGD